MTDTLNVWYEHTAVGELWRNATNQIGFGYSKSWLDESPFAVSVSLPLREDPFAPEDATAHRFFANLLPEGRFRDLIVGNLKIPDTDFDLLRAIGGDCAGALSIVEPGSDTRDPPAYEELDDDGLKSLVLKKGHVHTQKDGTGKLPRLSLAGAQDKCPVLLRDGRFYLPRGQSASTHILKFAIRDYRNVPAYETVLTSLAKRIGLNACTVEFGYVPIDDFRHDYIAVERYDRRVTKSGDVRRLHQEDFCQALGRGREHKYEDNDGITFAECFRLVREVSTDPAIDTEQLLRWQIFNLLAGNSDGHAKNLSLLYSEDGALTLAPFYDLVCTRAIEHIDERLAFSVAGERTPGDIRNEHWQELAKSLNVRPRFVLNLVRDIATRAQTEIRSVVDEFQEQHGDYAALQRVVQVVEQQCRRVLRN